jgi:3-oxoacyl-[acyl-carrier-protein] synthase II
MKRRRVKITGIGPVTPAGIGREAFWSGILEPVSRIRPYAKFGEEYGPFVAAHISAFDIGKYINDRSLLPKGAARHTLFAVAGAALALADAGIQASELREADCVIITGSSLMDFGGITSSTDAVHKRGAAAAIARTIFTTNITSVPEAINRMLGITARTMTLQNSCCAGMDAIGQAAALVSEGKAEIALCGGTEAPLHRCPLLELRAAGLTPTTTEMPERLARPFDLWRTTGVVSEGACMFVIEPETSKRRGYSYVAGYGFANDRPTDSCGGMKAAGKIALADAGLRPEEIDAINAWGPGHKFIDEGEARAMVDLFKSALAEIPAVSIKGAIGSPLGAAPAIQVAVTALAQKFGIIPPTVNWEYPDPACPLNLSGHARNVDHVYTLINSHGVGSVNSSLLLARC